MERITHNKVAWRKALWTAFSMCLVSLDTTYMCYIPLPLFRTPFFPYNSLSVFLLFFTLFWVSKFPSSILHEDTLDLYIIFSLPTHICCNPILFHNYFYHWQLQIFPALKCSEKKNHVSRRELIFSRSCTLFLGQSHASLGYIRLMVTGFLERGHRSEPLPQILPNSYAFTS